MEESLDVQELDVIVFLTNLMKRTDVDLKCFVQMPQLGTVTCGNNLDDCGAVLVANEFHLSIKHQLQEFLHRQSFEKYTST